MDPLFKIGEQQYGYKWTTPQNGATVEMTTHSSVYSVELQKNGSTQHYQLPSVQVGDVIGPTPLDSRLGPRWEDLD